LNSLTTHPVKARRLEKAVRQVDADRFIVTLHAKWGDTQVQIPVSRKKALEELGYAGTIGPLYVPIFEYARALHEKQPVPRVYLESDPTPRNWFLHDKALRYPSLQAALEGSGNGYYALTGKHPETIDFEKVDVSDLLNQLAPYMKTVTVSVNGIGKEVRTLTGQRVEVLDAHAYSLLDIDPTYQTVKVLNPHLGSKVMQLSYSEFKKGFGLMDIGYLPENAQLPGLKRTI
jgi:hypothetical protein